MKRRNKKRRFNFYKYILQYSHQKEILVSIYNNKKRLNYFLTQSVCSQTMKEEKFISKIDQLRQ